jgi:hypothetical protein
MSDRPPPPFEAPVLTHLGNLHTTLASVCVPHELLAAITPPPGPGRGRRLLRWLWVPIYFWASWLLRPACRGVLVLPDAREVRAVTLRNGVLLTVRPLEREPGPGEVFVFREGRRR